MPKRKYSTIVEGQLEGMLHIGAHAISHCYEIETLALEWHAFNGRLLATLRWNEDKTRGPEPPEIHPPILYVTLKKEFMFLKDVSLDVGVLKRAV